MRAIVALCAAQPRPAEFVLIAPPVDLETRRRFARATCGERRPPHERGADPDVLKPGACGSHVEVHLPARAETVGLVGRTGSRECRAPHRVTEVADAVQRCET